MICNIMRMLWRVGQNAGDKLGGEALQNSENEWEMSQNYVEKGGMTCKTVRMAWGRSRPEGMGWVRLAVQEVGATFLLVNA